MTYPHQYPCAAGILKPRRAPLLQIAAALALGGSVATLLTACKDSSSAPTDSAQQSQSAKTVTYTVRGEIAELPADDDPASEFRVHHESMPHYQRPDGTLGMNSMIMPFPPAASLSLEEFTVGDTIEMTFEVDYDATTNAILAFRATKVTKLPEGTALDFSPLAKPD